MNLLLLKLILAHLLGDFVFQTQGMVRSKSEKKIKSPLLYVHILIHAICLLFALAFNPSYFIGIALLLCSHFLIDVSKLYLQNKFPDKYLFTIDQILHLCMIACFVAWFETISWNFGELLQPHYLLMAIFVILVSYVSAILIKVLMKSWNLEADTTDESLKDAGKYIGILERLLIFTFILLQQWPGVGWLLAAKSIFRFGDLTRAKDRGLTEYILIGSLLSFGLAIGMALLYQYFANRF